MELAYSDIISGYFEFPTDNARRLLPPHLEPFELHHGSSILAVSMLDLPSSPVGPHRQVVMGIAVVPLVKADGRLPKAAVYPYLVATNNAMVRQVAGSMFHLPHWNEDVTIDLAKSGTSITGTVTSGAETVVELTVSEYEWEPTDYVYQCFTKDATGAYVGNIHVKGELSEHEEETGKLVLQDHPFNTGLLITDVYDVPFREVWTRKATQTFEPLSQLQLT
jgi:hypothetical protein